MRLDGVCRHYLAMTKSALFLFAHGGKKYTRNTHRVKLRRKVLSERFKMALLLLNSEPEVPVVVVSGKWTLHRLGSRLAAFIFKKLLRPEEGSTMNVFFIYSLWKLLSPVKSKRSFWWDLCKRKKRVHINYDAPTSEEHRHECFRLLIISSSWSNSPTTEDSLWNLSYLLISLSVFFPGVKLYGVACAVPIFFLFFFLSTRRRLQVYTVVRDWNRILGFFSLRAGSWSRQTQSRLTSSPRRFPRRSAVCVNTLFLRCLPADGQQWAYSPSAHMAMKKSR